MASYSMWLLEYAHIPTQAVSVVLAGQHNKGTRLMPFSYLVLKGEGHVSMIDVGLDPGQDDYVKQLVQKDDVEYWQPPENILAKIGLKPTDVDTVFLTHAHYDHMGNLMAFPNAQFYIQKREYQDWFWALSLPERYKTVLAAINPQDLENAKKLVECGRMTLIDGAQENVLPGIHLRPAYDGHTYASQMVIVENQEDSGTWIYCGDLAYARTNLTGIDGNGIYIPISITVGTQYNVMKSYDEMIEIIGGKLDHVIIGHETDSWEIFPSWKTEDNLHVSEVNLAPGEVTRKP
ncbi:MAG: N-acyl homoserine lactonase family protein [Anaerolineaceae bacterium]